jgi:hypothetical protein
MMERFAIIVPRKAYQSGIASWLTAQLCALLINACAMTPTGEVNHPSRFEFAVIGDQQYTAEDERNFPNLMSVLNEANPAFVVHVGDFQGDYNGYRGLSSNPSKI